MEQKTGHIFAVPHIEHGIEKPFYVDFVVMQKDGRVGLFDTKADLLPKRQNHAPKGWQNILLNKTRKAKKYMAESY